jgi:PadR family transcriptional regulator PadR
MPTQAAYRNRIELLQGTLDLLILQTLLWGPQHGYGISQAIGTQSNSVLRVDTGSLYPALHRLSKQGWVLPEWTVSDHKQRVKVYHLTTEGRKQLAQERSRWEKLQEAMASILDHTPQTEKA